MDVSCAVCGDEIDSSEVVEAMGARGARKFYDGLGCDACGYGTKKHYMFDPAEKPDNATLAKMRGDFLDSLEAATDEDPQEVYGWW